MPLHENFEHVFFDRTIPIKVLVQHLSTYKLHWHTQTELISVVKGSVSVHVAGESYLLSRGEMIYITGEELHAITKTEDDHLLVAIQFDPDFFNLLPDIKASFFRRDAFIRDQREHLATLQTLFKLVIDIVWQYNKRPISYQYQIASQAFEIFALMVRQGYFAESAPRTDDQERSLKHINRIIDYINTHYADNLSLHSIAEQEHISYYHLSHVFKEVTGITFREHLSNVRLHQSMHSLKNTRNSVLSIALSHGFANAKSYSNAFQRRYGVTPGDYRRHFQHVGAIEPDTSAIFDIGNENNILYETINSDADLSYIYSLNTALHVAKEQNAVGHKEVYADIDMNATQGPLRHVWSEIGACGRAADLLKQTVQEHVLRAAQAHGYRYLRFHGIFCDDMMIYNRTNDGKTVYNWLYVDQVFDFLLRNGLKPFLELSFMPSELASGSSTLFFYRANISTPRDMGAWADMVRALFTHCIDRYGENEVVQWYVEVWNEPDYRDVFWAGTREDYFALYEASVRAVKSVCAGIRVGGPSITHIHYATTDWIEQFLQMCRERDLPCDFLSYHIYADLSPDYSRLEKDNLFPKLSTSARIIDDIENNLIATHRETAQRMGFPALKHIVTEWNVSSKPRFRIRDTAFMAPYIISTALRCQTGVHALTYWCITDLIEELKAPIDLFHGGLGLINSAGIPKPSFWAMNFLHRLGEEIVCQQEGCMVTRGGGGYQILLYNLAKLDQIAQHSTDFSSEYEDDLYTLFEEKPGISFLLTLKGLKGTWRATHYVINRQCGSAYDRWRDMGALPACSPDELEHLQHLAVPWLSGEILHAGEGDVTLEIAVPIHGIHLILLSPIHAP